MVSKRFFFLIVLTLSTFICRGQDETIENTAVDSLKTDLEDEGMIVIDTLIAQKRGLNPLAPAKAGFYSAVLPGLGQIYNKRYWKVPIVWAAIGGSVYFYFNFNNRYQAFRSAFKNRRVGLPFEENRFVNIPETITDDQLERLQNARQNDRDQTLLVAILFYALNIVDANVDAHLKQFNIDDKLSMDMEIQPFLELNPVTNDPNYGMAVIIKF